MTRILLTLCGTILGSVLLAGATVALAIYMTVVMLREVFMLPVKLFKELGGK